MPRASSYQLRVTSEPRPFAASIACSALMIRFSSTCFTWWGSEKMWGSPLARASRVVMFDTRCS